MHFFYVCSSLLDAVQSPVRLLLQLRGITKELQYKSLPCSTAGTSGLLSVQNLHSSSTKRSHSSCLSTCHHYHQECPSHSPKASSGPAQLAMQSIPSLQSKGGSSFLRRSPGKTPIAQQQSNHPCTFNAALIEKRYCAVLTQEMSKHSALNSEECTAVLSALIKEFENRIVES